MREPSAIPASRHPAALPLAGAAGLMGGGAVLAGLGLAGAAGAGLAGLVMALVAGIGLSGLTHHPHDRLGPANLVTLTRAALLAVLAGLIARPGGLAADAGLAWAAVALAAAGLCLDGLDGWLARRTGLASAFGARFDMEVDAGLAAVLCVLAILSGKAGLWLIPLGFLRYAWVAAGLVLPWLEGPLPPRFSRKAVCVLQIAVLIALIAPVVVPPASGLLALAATGALVWSFARDALWRWRQG